MAIAFVDAAGSAGTTTSASVTLPTASAGDVMVIFIHSCTSDDTTSGPTFPGGWTTLESFGATATGSTSASYGVAWRAWQSGDSAPTVSVVSVASGGWAAVCASYSGVDTTAAFADDGSTFRGASSSSALATPTVTGDAATWRVHAYGGYNTFSAPTWGTPGSSTERLEQAGSGGTIISDAAWSDSNGDVDTSGGVSVSATPGGSTTGAVGWIGVLTPGGGGGPGGGPPVGRMVIA